MPDDATFFLIFHRKRVFFQIFNFYLTPRDSLKCVAQADSNFYGQKERTIKTRAQLNSEAQIEMILYHFSVSSLSRFALLVARNLDIDLEVNFDLFMEIKS